MTGFYFFFKKTYKLQILHWHLQHKLQYLIETEPYIGSILHLLAPFSIHTHSAEIYQYVF